MSEENNSKFSLSKKKKIGLGIGAVAEAGGIGLLVAGLVTAMPPLWIAGAALMGAVALVGITTGIVDFVKGRKAKKNAALEAEQVTNAPAKAQEKAPAKAAAQATEKSFAANIEKKDSHVEAALDKSGAVALAK